MSLQGKVAIVTGAAKGIGRGVAETFVERGARVVLVDWDEETGRATTEELAENGGEVHFMHCDVSQKDQVEAMVEEAHDKYGRIDILVNNAGIGVYMELLEATEEDWEKCLAVNLKGVFLCSKQVIPHMQEQGSGAIVNISSVHAEATVGGVAPYAASKGGITALTRNMAIDYGPEIRVNAIAPGWVLTPLIQSIFDSYDDPEAQQREVEQRQVMKRIGRPADIGRAAAFLASEEADFITGTQLFVDGGLTAQLETW